jgi:hypothetical protein
MPPPEALYDYYDDEFYYEIIYPQAPATNTAEDFVTLFNNKLTPKAIALNEL